jgi:hypothetical protein
MTSLWLWPVLFFLMPAQASLMRLDPGRGCTLTGTAVTSYVTIVCQGVDLQVLQPLTAMLDTVDQDLYSTIRGVEARMHIYHALALGQLAQGTPAISFPDVARALNYLGAFCSAGKLSACAGEAYRD